MVTEALHPTPLYWIPATLVEFVTAWLAYQAVEAAQKITRSNISKQDKRFAKLIFGMCVALATPTLVVSFAANRYEFRGHFGLALLFPASCIACAVASAIPHIKEQAVSSKVADERKETQKWRDNARKLGQRCTELEQRCSELAQARAMKKADAAIYREICAGMNGDAPANAKEVNRLLNDCGYYAVSDSTARSWV